eukprot:2452070-Amphidinium_carterae.1
MADAVHHAHVKRVPPLHEHLLLLVPSSAGGLAALLAGDPLTVIVANASGLSPVLPEAGYLCSNKDLFVSENVCAPDLRACSEPSTLRVSFVLK